MRTKGFCSSLRRNEVDRGKARACHFGPYREYRENEAAPTAEQNPSVGNLVSPYRMCPASFSFSGLDGAEITLFS